MKLLGNRKISIFWFRRDLRLEDNAGLYHALKSSKNVLPIFIFDQNILNKLNASDDPRVTFIYNSICDIKLKLQELNSDLHVYYGDPIVVWRQILDKYDVSSVFTNRDYETYAINRDEQVKNLLLEKNVFFNTYKDHVILEGGEVLKDDGKPYTVFTPFKNKWLAKLKSKSKLDIIDSYYFKSYPTEAYFNNFLNVGQASPMIALSDMGFEPSKITMPSKTVSQNIISQYHENRDFPAIDGTSKLGIHFRFGTISIREKARKSAQLNATYLSELIWRDFYAMILFNFPHVQKGAFKPLYDEINWRNDEHEFELWKLGKTGYPIVDAGMRELAATGHMHNRVRMITASFLTKHLLIDWRWGEAWFAEKLLDFDLASNNGGWQWASGSGTDAAPYFRIFNPTTQAEKFDAKGHYIKKWVPEYGSKNYPLPMVDHKFARERCLKVYKEALDVK